MGQRSTGRWWLVRGNAKELGKRVMGQGGETAVEFAPTTYKARSGECSGAVEECSGGPLPTGLEGRRWGPVGKEGSVGEGVREERRRGVGKRGGRAAA